MEDFQKRMLDEHSELKDRLTKLNAALAKYGFREKVGDYQYKLMKEQAQGMDASQKRQRIAQDTGGYINHPDPKHWIGREKQRRMGPREARVFRWLLF